MAGKQTRILLPGSVKRFHESYGWLEMMAFVSMKMPRYMIFSFIFKALNLNSKIQPFGLRIMVMKLQKKWGRVTVTTLFREKIIRNFKWRCYCGQHRDNLLRSYLENRSWIGVPRGPGHQASHYSVN